MSTPHNAARLGEQWNPERLAVLQAEIEALKDYVTLSGGWAWHYMTPAGHIEYKHAHAINLSEIRVGYDSVYSGVSGNCTTIRLE